MISGGDWIVPTYRGEPWFEKPILVYWFAGLASSVFGPDFGLRLPSFLSSVATMALVAWFLRRHFDDRAAVMSVLALATSLIFVAMGRLLMADPLLILGLTAAILMWIDAVLTGKRTWIGSAIGLGFGFLAKGPVAIVLFLFVVTWSLLATRRQNADFRLHRIPWFPFSVVFLAVASTWYLPALVRSPSEFFGTFIVEQNFYRLLGADLAHRVPFWLGIPFYFVVLAISAAPWWWFALKGWPKRGVWLDSREFCVRVLARWAAVVVVLFTIMGSKLPHYVAPAMIPLAMLAGIWTARNRTERSYSRAVAFSLAGCVVCFIVANVAFVAVERRAGADESRRIANYARQSGYTIAEYQIRTRKRDLSISVVQKETALPSLRVYFGRDVLWVESAEELAKLPSPSLVFTRKGRLDEVDLSLLDAIGVNLKRLPVSGAKFELYELTKAPSDPEPVSP
jgi:4-amino-4-deoxy-L-arabinose transferase-like glycosyltransferase